MATLITALAQGIPRAASGTAYFYRSGTGYGTPATVYADIDGETAIGTSVTLNAYGQYESSDLFGVYTKERVDVLVYQSGGSTVAARFSDGHYDNAIDVESDSFTGTLASGSTGAGGHTLLRTVLDAWIASGGATNFNVLETGQTVERTLKDALQSIRNANTMIINVEDYGATHDGVTDDAPFIQAALNAAALADVPLVYMPSGTYLLSRGVSMPTPVSLIGENADVTIWSCAFGVGDALSIAAGSGAVWDSCRIGGFTIKAASGSVTGSAIISSAYGAVISNMYITEFSTPLITSNTSFVLFNKIRGATNNTASCIGATLGGTGTVFAFNDIKALGAWDNTCRLVALAAANITVLGGTYDISLAGTLTRCIETADAAAANCRVIGANYIGASGDVGFYLDRDVAFFEAFNSTTTAGLLLFDAAADTYITKAQRGSRVGSTNVATEGTATYTPTADTELHYVRFAAALAIGAPTGSSTQGQVMKFVLHNNSAGALTPTFNAIYHVGTVPAVAAGEYLAFSVRYQPTTGWLGSSLWFLEGGFATYA